jgi:F-box/TPR repeat protein Pof3
MTKLSPPKRADPLAVLPRELAEQILGYLSFKQLMNTCLVSTGWTQFICRTPNLWRHLDLTHTKGKVKNAFVSRAIKIGRSKLRTATLSNLFDFDKALSALARTCPLEELNLRNTGLLAYEIVNILKPVKNLRTLRIHKGTSILWRALSDILLNSAETLDALVCEDLPITQSSSDLYFSERNFPNMRELDLSWSSGWRGSPSLVKSLANMSNLQSLKLHQLSNKESIVHDRVDLSMLTNLSHLDLLLDIRHAGHIILSSSIKSLAIGTWQPRHAKFFHPPAGIEPVKWSLPLLEELRICAAQVPFSDFEFALRTSFLPDTQTPVCLHKLSMTASGVRGNLNKETLSHPRLRELKHLSLERCFDTDDDCLSLVAKDLPKLEFLNVSGTDVTGAGIKKVVSNGLKKLVANNCRHVYPDAVQWARTQGVKVEHKMSDGMAGGKKLRH